LKESGKRRSWGELATNKSKKYNPKNENNFIKCIELEHLGSGTGQLLGFVDGSKSESIKNIFLKDDVLFGKLRPYLRKYHQPTFDGVCSSEIWVLNGKKISNAFLYYLIQTNMFIDLANQSSGSKMPRADWNIIENGVFSFPPISEQQKVHSFLSLIDERINTQKKIIENLETLIKKMSEELFTQKTRFKKDLIDWEVKKLREICKVYDGTHQTPNYVDDGIPFYSVEHLTANQFDKTKFISEEVFEKENKRVILERGDILMTRIGSIGVAKYINWDVNASFYVSLALIKKSRKINNEYLCHFMNSSFFQSELWKRTIHVAFPQKINLGEIGDCLIKIPSFTEQTKIANFLSSIDEKIKVEKSLLQQYESQKKYLLANLFV